MLRPAPAPRREAPQSSAVFYNISGARAARRELRGRRGVEAFEHQNGVDGEEPGHLFRRVRLLALCARAAEHGPFALHCSQIFTPFETGFTA